jgi:two-component system cell cycle sensor histidine kinase/response regulator CckA
MERSASEILTSELSYRRLFEAAQDGILILDIDEGRITDVNPFLASLLGFARDEMLGKTVGELSPFKDIESNKVMLGRLQADGYVRYDDLPLETRDGRKIDVEFVSNVYTAGDVKVIQCNIRDITARKAADRRLTAQLVAAQKMEVVGQLAGGVAHDFNNVLAVIMGYADLMAADLEQGSPVRVYAEEIQHASARAAGLTRQLLVFSRKHQVQPVVLDLNVVVGDLEKMLRRLIDENIDLKIVRGTGVVRVCADAGYIGQVVMNLVVNARDAMPNGGTLTIAIGTAPDRNEAAHGLSGERVTISVSDTGTGMTGEVMSRIFEPFFTTKELGKGTGLGLATCKTIVEQSGGQISVSSEVGKGTTFQIFLPSVDAPAEVAAPAPARILPGGTETILVVEDEPSVRHLARGVLQARGYTVLSASNGQEALHVVRDHVGPPIRLVVTDVIMPLMGGKVMAEWLKTTHPEMKVLFTSGYTDDAIAHHGVLDAGLEFLAKPYAPSVLVQRVRELLDVAADGS